MNASKHALPSTAILTACPLLVKRVSNRRLFNGLSSATRILYFELLSVDGASGKGYRFDVDVLVMATSVERGAELEDALTGDNGIFGEKGSVGGVGKEISKESRVLESSPASILLKGIVIDTLVPFPSPSEDMLICIALLL
jgi:hypothetical protein